MNWMFSEQTWRGGSSSCSGPPWALLAFGSVWRGILLHGTVAPWFSYSGNPERVCIPSADRRSRPRSLQVVGKPQRECLQCCLVWQGLQDLHVRVTAEDGNSTQTLAVEDILRNSGSMTTLPCHPSPGNFHWCSHTGH